MAEQLLGKATIKVDGMKLKTKPGAKFDLGGTSRTTVNGDNEVLGYAAQTKQSVLECTIVVAKGTSLKALQDTTDATVTFECDTGQTYVGRGMYLVDTLSITSGEGGEVPIKMEGQPAEEMGA